MGKTGEEDADADARPVKKEKKSKKSKKMANDILDVDAGNKHIEVNAKKKDHKHGERKRRSDEDGDRHSYKGKSEDADDLRKKDEKSKIDSSEKAPRKENEQGEADEPVVDRDYDPKPTKKKKKHGIETHDAGDLQKKDKKRKRDSSEKVPRKENEQGEGDEHAVERDCDPKPTKKKKKKHGIAADELGKEGYVLEDGEGSKRSKKKKSGEKDSKKHEAKGKKKNKPVENNMEKPTAKKGTPKKVSFSSHVEVFPPPDTGSVKQKTNEDDLVRGKRFTPEEDELVKEAVQNYIIVHGLGDEGINMLMNCGSNRRRMRKCWREIGTCIPYRPYTAIYYRAHILFERAEEREWSTEEIEFLKEFHANNGNKWKTAALELGKHRFHVKDAWRRYKFKDLKSGRWTQEEYQHLYDLVNLDLKLKLTEQEKDSKYGMLKDNIPWCAISEKLGTRTDANCCAKWYKQLTSPLVAERKWADADDYRLIGALYELDAACVEDVDWDSLLEHRDGEVCRKRWDQMVRHIGHHKSKPFADQVDTLAKRYCPDLAETRDSWDKKPVVP